MTSPAGLDEPIAGGGNLIRVDQLTIDDHAVEIRVEGELDLATAPRLKWPLIDSLGAGVTGLVVNFECVTFIDSTALSVLVGVRRKLPLNARMAIACANPNVLRIFSIAGLDGVFAIFPTAAEATEYVCGRGDDAAATTSGEPGDAAARGQVPELPGQAGGDRAS